MLRILEPGSARPREIAEGDDLPAAAIWIDLFCPAAQEESRVEALLGHDIPTREEMEEIEASSRLYRDSDASVMTATLVSVSEQRMPVEGPVTFVLSGERLVTVRYHAPRPFETYVKALERRPIPESGADVLVGLLETVVDRLADILEESGARLEEVATTLFESRETMRSAQQSETYEALLTKIGVNSSRIGKAQQSLSSLSRLMGFVRLPDKAGDTPASVEELRSDLKSLIEHNSYLEGRISFLLDATLGFINTAQNKVMNLFSVLAVIFLPPTLVASIYGMNFEIMPELDWAFGYPWALALMAVFAVVPYLYFKHRNWL